MENVKDFDEVFRLYYPLMLSFARKFVNDDAACEDIVNDAFEEVWRHFSAIKRESAKSFLFTTVRRLCIDYLRHVKCQTRYAEFVEIVASRYIDTEARICNEDLSRVARRVVEELGPPTSEIFKACYVDGKKYREVAEEMGYSVASIKKYMVRALRAIREKRLN